MIHLYTGDGKGKTTAAVGMAVRATGHGLHVMFCQFMKNGNSGELSALKALQVSVICAPPMNKMTFEMTNEEWGSSCRAQLETVEVIEQSFSAEQPDMVILDEMATAIGCQMLERARCEELLRCLKGAEVVITGRNAPAWLRECADYLSEIHSIRHPYEKGISARHGIEW